MTIFIRSQTNRMASSVSASRRRDDPVEVALRGRRRFSGRATCGGRRKPCAGRWRARSSPEGSERLASSASAGSAPMTRVDGDRPFTASAVPEAVRRRRRGRGRRRAARPGRAAPTRRSPGRRSRASRRRDGSVRGRGADFLGHGRLARGERRLAGHDACPVALDGRALDRRAPCGASPRRPERRAAFPAAASAWPWLPEEWVTTPARLPLSPSCKRAFIAPRNLNAPTFWKFSHLKQTEPPHRRRASPT